MSRATPATRALDAAGIAYRLHRYDYDPGAANLGRQAAEALGIDPARMLKTLLLDLDGQPVCALLPVDRELSLKKLAAALGGKRASLLAATAAERISGYRIGGISPFGQKKRLPVAIETSALAQATVYCNGGQRGLQLEIAPDLIVNLLGARPAELSGE
ncbi:MAG: Cys-tRNA(Pro) deacylase [Lysobacteraceae bacterium]